MRTTLCLAGLAAFISGVLLAEPLSRPLEVDFHREIPSRNLQGFATRSDGRLVTGPRLRALEGEVQAELLWCLSPAPATGQWLAGSGPDGRILSLSLDLKAGRFQSAEYARLPDSQILSLCVLPDGSVLAGSSPRGILGLFRDGRLLAQISLPADSVLDLLPTKDGRVLASTGNPARIYSVDIQRLAGSGTDLGKPADSVALQARGVTLFGEVRDRNLGRLALLPDGSVVAGSSPKGNLYQFGPKGGAAQVLMENREAEITDLLVLSDGTLYVSVVQAASGGESRINRGPQAGANAVPPALAAPGVVPGGGGQAQSQPAQQERPAQAELLPAAQQEKFAGRSQLFCIAPGGFPELVSARNGLSIYRLALHGDWVLMAGGEQGDLVGYDLVHRMAMTFPGSQSSQLNDLAALPGEPGRLLVLRNNLPGLSLLDFNDQSERIAETRRIELAAPSRIGGLRIPSVLGGSPFALRLELKLSSGSEDLEGWSDWQALVPSELEGQANYGWQPASLLRGRHLRLRVSMPAAQPSGVVVDKAVIHQAPQNRRPQLNEFRTLSQGFEIIPPPEPQTPVVTNLGQIISQPSSGLDSQSERRKASLMSSQVVPSPGVQEFFWNVGDPDGDNLVVNFSIRKAGSIAWEDLLLGGRESHVRVDTTRLAEGLYQTRLSVCEDAPRPSAERLSNSFLTEEFIVDRTSPVISSATVVRQGDKLVLRVQGEDSLSLLEGAHAVFNNGFEISGEQPEDGILDQRREAFVIELDPAQAVGASQVELMLYDQAGNRSNQVVPLR